MLPLLLVALYETGVMTEGAYAGDVRMDYVLQTVGIFGFQRSFHHLPVDSYNLPPHRDCLLFQVDILPMKPQQRVLQGQKR